SPFRPADEREPSLQVAVQRVSGIERAPRGPPFIELRIHRREQLRAQARILGEIDAAARRHHELVEAVEQLSELRAAGRDIERECPPFDREAEHRTTVLLEALQHREERWGPGRAQALKGRAHHVFGPVRHHELVLHEPARPVDLVPAAHAVEDEEEGPEADDVAAGPTRRLAEPELVERAY